MNSKSSSGGSSENHSIHQKNLFLSSQHTHPTPSPSIEIHKPDKSNPNIQSEHNVTVSSLMVDSNIQRRHSMDTSSNQSANNAFVKSQSTIMPPPMNDSSSAIGSSLSPTGNRRKSVSSKERLFSVQSLQRTSSNKSQEHLIKGATQSDDTSNPTKVTTLSVITPENV